MKFNCTIKESNGFRVTTDVSTNSDAAEVDATEVDATSRCSG